MQFTDIDTQLMAAPCKQNMIMIYDMGNIHKHDTHMTALYYIHKYSSSNGEDKQTIRLIKKHHKYIVLYMHKNSKILNMIYNMQNTHLTTLDHMQNYGLYTVSCKQDVNVTKLNTEYTLPINLHTQT